MGDYEVYELYHYGVKGMKWGVRRYQNPDGTLTAAGRKRLAKQEYRQTAEGKVKRATTIGTIFGGPLVGAAVGLIANKKYNSDSVQAAASKGKKLVDDNSNKKVSELSTKTESKKVADLKSRVTGKKEDGKPAFLMSQQELETFSANYTQRKNTLVKQYKSATDTATKERIRDQVDRLENDYLSVVEQDFWYKDD